MVKIGVLTSSRADFGVYLPLLKRIEKEKEMDLEIIAFGTHLSRFHGYTIEEIQKSGFKVRHQIPTLLASDSEEGVSTSSALCSLKFSSFWTQHKKEFDLVLCLGDRYEMFAAVSAGVPFGIKFAHLYGGDRSLGAIDNIYRDCLTHFSSVHFTSTQRCANRVKELKPGNDPVQVVGLLSLDDLDEIKLLSLQEFKDQWEIDLSNPTILVTLHPETVSPEKNESYSEVIFETLLELTEKFQIVLTMPNADTEGYTYRQQFRNLKKLLPGKVFLIENFGRESYFMCMKHSMFIIGNSSSGISEAASFKKYAINIGDRQLGRETGPNVFHTPFEKNKINELVSEILKNPVFEGENIYQKSGGVAMLMKQLKP